MMCGDALVGDAGIIHSKIGFVSRALQVCLSGFCKLLMRLNYLLVLLPDHFHHVTPFLLHKLQYLLIVPLYYLAVVRAVPIHLVHTCPFAFQMLPIPIFRFSGWWRRDFHVLFPAQLSQHIILLPLFLCLLFIHFRVIRGDVLVRCDKSPFSAIFTLRHVVSFLPFQIRIQLGQWAILLLQLLSHS